MDSWHVRMRELAKELPDKPGVYLYYDEGEKIIYVGKAKMLRKRVLSYFTKKTHSSGKTALLVKRTRNIQYIVVESEYEALLLENNLIKKYQPRYNIQWKDDKTYPFICIKKERFPRVMPVRNPVKDGSEYFGPYASVRIMNTLLELIRGLFQLRTCKYLLSETHIEKRKYRVCLEYHLGNCLGPCEGRQTEEDYDISIRQIRKIIQGHLSEVIAQLKKKMQGYADSLEFEKAKLLKDKLDMLEHYRAKSTVVNPRISDVDVFAICTDDGFAYVNYLHIVKGAIVQAHTVEVKKKLDETEKDILLSAIAEMRSRFQSASRYIYLPEATDLRIPGVKMHVPVKGDKKRLLELSYRNAFQIMKNKQMQRALSAGKKAWQRKLLRLKNDLQLSDIPYRIECFDISNLGGSHIVACCVVYNNAVPVKSAYRLFNMKTVKGQDDFASMREVVFRRYKRVVKENGSLPQLIIVDGGKGQLNAALQGLNELGLGSRIAVIGIAKKLEEIFKPGVRHPLYIDKRSESLRLIQQMRNEAHRFGIAHHRKKRMKANIRSELTKIKGIGKETAALLLKNYGSVKQVRKANQQELAKLIGPAKAGLVVAYFTEAV